MQALVLDSNVVNTPCRKSINTLDAPNGIVREKVLHVCDAIAVKWRVNITCSVVNHCDVERAMCFAH